MVLPQLKFVQSERSQSEYIESLQHFLVGKTQSVTSSKLMQEIKSDLKMIPNTIVCTFSEKKGGLGWPGFFKREDFLCES